MKKYYTYILLLIAFATAGKTLNAQAGMDPYVDIYSAETLKGKGILCIQLQQPLTLTGYNDRFEPIGVLPATYWKLISENLSLLQVCEQKGAYFRLTPYTKNANPSDGQPTSVWVEESELVAMGFHSIRYIPLEELVAFCKANPTIVKDMLGAEVQTQAQIVAVRPVRYQYLILREKPDDSAPFVPIATPCGTGGGKTTVLSRSGDWFQLQLYIRCIYNGSKDPNVCARSLFEKEYTGYWKAPCDENGFPYLLVESLGNGSSGAWPALIDYAKNIGSR